MSPFAPHDDALNRALAAYVVEDAPPDLVDRLVRQATPRQTRSSLRYVAPMAASLVLGVFIGYTAVTTPPRPVFQQEATPFTLSFDTLVWGSDRVDEVML